MRQKLILILALFIIFTGNAFAASQKTIKAKLLTGQIASESHGSDVVATILHEPYNECFIIGKAKANMENRIISIEFNNISCITNNSAIEYSLNNWPVISGSTIGIKAKKGTTSKSTLAIIDSNIALLTKIKANISQNNELITMIKSLESAKNGYLYLESGSIVSIQANGDPVQIHP